MESRRFLTFVPRAENVHFDIDKYLNRIIPPSQLHRLPRPISRFLGYREDQKPDVGNVLVAFWALIGAFCGLVLVAAVFRYFPVIQMYNPPVVFASLGAAAVLEYNAIHSPLAQPRNDVFGHGIAAIIGVSIAKLFRLHADFHNLRWLAGPLACGLASAAMTLTNTIHPPGGATAILAVIDPTVGAMGWMFVPLILLGSVLMVMVALIVNNICRRYPVCWWTTKEVGRRKEKASPSDVESLNESGSKTVVGSWEFSGHTGFGQVIIIGAEGVSLPHGFHLEAGDAKVMKSLVARLQDPSAEDTVTAEDVQHQLSHTTTHHPQRTESPEEKCSEML